MATPARGKSPTAEAAAEPAETASATTETLAPPIIRKKKKKRKKRRYTRGTKRMQQLERGLRRGTARIGLAVGRGLDSFRKRSNRSARKKRDGARRDLARNLSRGLGVTLRRASDAPYDVMRRINIRRIPLDPFGFLR